MIPRTSAIGPRTRTSAPVHAVCAVGIRTNDCTHTTHTRAHVHVLLEVPLGFELELVVLGHDEQGGLHELRVVRGRVLGLVSASAPVEEVRLQKFDQVLGLGVRGQDALAAVGVVRDCMHLAQLRVDGRLFALFGVRGRLDERGPEGVRVAGHTPLGLDASADAWRQDAGLAD